MKTGSLRARVILITLALFAIVLTVVVTAVTLAYRAELGGQLRGRLADAGVAVERSDPRDLKPLIPVLALEGFATHLSGSLSAAPHPAPNPAPTTAAEAGSAIQTHGSLLVLDEVLPGGPQVSLSASLTGVDHGPGIPEDQSERIFERFARLDPTKPGHGLGLAIARRVAQQHHGDLTCDPTPAGASFTLHLPTQH